MTLPGVRRFLIKSAAPTLDEFPVLGCGVNPLVGFASLIPVPTTASGQVQEVVMLVGIVAAAVLVCACTVVVLRRRGRSRG